VGAPNAHRRMMVNTKGFDHQTCKTFIHELTKACLSKTAYIPSMTPARHLPM